MLVLETDEPHPDTAATHGSFGDVFDQLFQEAGASHDPPLGIETSMHFVVEPKGGSIPDISAFDNIHAVLITGSCADAHGDDGWILKLIALLRGEFCFLSVSGGEGNKADEHRCMGAETGYPVLGRVFRPSDFMPHAGVYSGVNTRESVGTGAYGDFAFGAGAEVVSHEGGEVISAPDASGSCC